MFHEKKLRGPFCYLKPNIKINLV